MLFRQAQHRLLRMAQTFSVVVVTGPRQSGKTTLVQNAFPGRPYVSMEDLDVRRRVQDDPRLFLQQHADGVLIDEVQRVPELLSYLQTQVDAQKLPGRYILTGSQNLLMTEQISQSLAGRAAYLDLLPLSYAESQSVDKKLSLDALMLRGSYPQVVMSGVTPSEWFEAYVRSYIERDVRQISQINDLTAFQRFLRMMAARTGQLVNLNAIGADLGLAQTTIKAWLSILEASYITFRLLPYHTHFGKRLVKTPKLYFYDTGLAAWLLGIHDVATMNVHPMRGALFENFMILQYLKFCKNTGRNDHLYFWRDNTGNEMDLLIERAGVLSAIEFKSGATFNPEWLRAMDTWMKHTDGARRSAGMVISDAPMNAWYRSYFAAHWRSASMQLAADLPANS
jgi:uncharacterized protein